MKTVLRSQPTILSDSKKMLYKHDFFHKDLNSEGKGFSNQFEVQIYKGEKIVIDQASGLMWQHGYSPDELTFEDSKKWVEKLNREGYAGYNDWRLPTLEESMSLMNPKKNQSGAYIDSIFDCQKAYFWTSDLSIHDAVCVVDYRDGTWAGDPPAAKSHARAVRTMK